MTDHPDIVERLQHEADLCRNEGATDIALLLSDASGIISFARKALEEMNADVNRLRAEAEALRKDKAMLLENLEQMLRQFTKTPSSYKDSDTRCKAHAAIAATKEQQA